MKDFVNDQINELLQELEGDVLGLVKQLWDRVHGGSEEVAERLCLLSGIPQERLKEIIQKLAENSEGEIILTVQEIHSLCNVIRYISSSFRYLDNRSVLDEIAAKSDSIIERWNDRVNYSFDYPGNLFDKLVRRAGTGSFEEFLSAYHIFIDTSALCDENTDHFLDLLISEIQKISNPLKVTVPRAVVDCLQSMEKDAEENYIFGADEGLRNLKKIQEAGILSVRGDEADTTVMSTFISAFSRFKPVYKMLLITQDEALAKAVEMLNTSGVEGAEILICKVAETSMIDLWFEKESIDITPVETPAFEMKKAGIMPVEESAPEDKSVGITPVIGAFTPESAWTMPLEESVSEDENAENVLVEESAFDDEISADADEEALKTVSSFQLEESGMDSSGGDLMDDEIETDIEKMSDLEEQLANMLGKNPKYTDDTDDDELTDNDEFDTDDEFDPDEDLKKGADLDFSEDDVLMAGSFQLDSWDILD